MLKKEKKLEKEYINTDKIRNKMMKIKMKIIKNKLKLLRKEKLKVEQIKEKIIFRCSVYTLDIIKTMKLF